MCYNGVVTFCYIKSLDFETNMKGDTKMLRIDKITVKKVPGAGVTLYELEEVMYQKMKEGASSTKFRITQEEGNLLVYIEKPISLQTVNRIFRTFSNEGIKIKKIVWESEMIGPHERGNLEVIVS